MEEAQGGVCVACGGEVPKLNEEGKCDQCAGGGEAATMEMNPTDETPVAD